MAMQGRGKSHFLTIILIHNCAAAQPHLGLGGDEAALFNGDEDTSSAKRHGTTHMFSSHVHLFILE